MESEPPELTAPRRTFALRVSASELTFHATALVWLCTAAVLWSIGWILARTLPVPPPNATAAAEMVPWFRVSLAPEPDERRLYVLLTLLSPLLLLIAWVAVRRFLPRPAGVGSTLEWRASTAWTAASAAVVFLLGGSALHLWITSPILAELLLPSAKFGLLTLAVVLAFWWVSSWRIRLRPRPLWRILRKVWRNLFLVAALLLALAGSVLYRVFDYRTAAMVNPVNFNTTFYPIAQAANGQHILVDFLPQYGCYGEMLKPWFALIGLSVSNVTVTLTALQCIALGSIAFVLSRLLRSGWLVLMGLAALIWVGEIWFEAEHNLFDPYFQYFPIRLIFPALSLLAAWAYLRRPTGRRAAVLGGLGGLATWWNIDSGAVTLVSLLGLLFVKALSDRGLSPAIARWRGARHFGVALGAALLALGGFYLMLCLEARQKIDLGTAFRAQNIFYISGYYMLRMPVNLHLWHLVVGVYLLGLAGTLGCLSARRPLSVSNGMILYLSVLGLGLFSYFQGRSHDYVLLSCLWPAAMVALILADRQLTAARYRLLPRAYAAAALPALLLLAFCALCLWQTRRDIIQVNRDRWQFARQHPDGTNIPAQVAYIKRTVRRGEPCEIIAPHQAIYYTATRIRAELPGQSLFECMLNSDVAHYLTQLRERRARRLFTEFARTQEDYKHLLGPEFGRTVYDFYRLVSRSPDGSMLYWEPRSDEEIKSEPPGRLAREFAARSRLQASPITEHHALRGDSGGVLFDAAGDCVTAPYDWGLVPFGSDWALEIVFTPAADQPENACLISNHPGSGHDGLTIQRPPNGAPGEFVCGFGDGKAYTPSALLHFEPKQEHYLAISCEANRITICIDGAQSPQITLPAPVAPSVHPLTIGDWIMGGRDVRGDIAEVKIHAHALSAEMIARNAASVHPDPKPDVASPTANP